MRVASIIKGKNSKNPCLIAVIHDADGNKRRMSFTISGLSYGQYESLQRLLTQVLTVGNFDFETIRKLGWQHIIDFKNEQEPPVDISRFEFNHTVPDNFIKLTKFTIAPYSTSTSLYLYTHAQLDGQESNVEISLGIPSFLKKGKNPDVLEKQFLEQVDGMTRDGFLVKTRGDAVACLRKIMRNILLEMQLIDKKMANFTENDPKRAKGDFISSVLQRKSRTRQR